MAAERAEFKGASGDTLAARIDRPAGPPHAWVLFAHCFSCSKDVFAARRIAQNLADRGFAVMRFDFTGLGNSEGDFANTNFSSNVADLIAAAGFLRETEAAPAILVGHSLGGAASIVAAEHIPEAKAVVTIGAPADAEHVKHNFDAHLEEIETKGEAEVSLAGRPFRIKKQFLEDIAGQKVEAAVTGLRRALLLIHSPLDETVSIDNATRLFVAAKHPKSFLSLDDADHLLTRQADAEHVADVVAAWSARYAGIAPPAAPAAAAGPNAVVVRETGRGGFENHVVVGPHVLLADEPPAFGGGGAGPNPYEFLNAALGACTAMTLRMYANRKGWPLARVSVTLNHEKTHADDCIRCEEDDKARVDVITRELTVEGDLDEAQRAKLLEIADKCPVHRTLHGPLAVRTTLT